jgi:two-component system phosphate regulon sensor histidine kinase PhoR
MIRPRRYFPWKIARQFFVGHFLFFLSLLLLTGFTLRFYAYANFLNSNDIPAALARFDSYLTNVFVSVLAISAIYLLISTRYYARPLGRLLQRARELRRFDAPVSDDVVIDADSLNEEPGEWFNLERALNRIHKDLRSKTADLSREREELSALIGAVSDAILAIDNTEMPLFFNSQFALLFGVTRDSTARSRSLGEIFRVPEVLSAYRKVLQTGRPEMVPTTLHTSNGGMPRFFNISIAPLLSEGTPVFGALGIFHDVTELKQSEQIRIEFVGNASHELRTPLTNIKGYFDTLAADLKLNRIEDALKFSDIISRNIDRLMFLVNDLLDLSALESSGELIKTLVPVRELTESALRELNSKIVQKRQEVQVYYHLDQFEADAQRVEQVLINLIHNANKYIPEGRRIDIFWDRVNGNTVLRVKDNGPGIAIEHQARLFERFYRVDAGRSREAGGTGLGLSIVKHIMIKHGGSVRLVSRTGEGSEFICTFSN